MLAALKFVQGAVAKKDFVPALTHFLIEKGSVRGFNGVMALCSPIPLDLECKPKADSIIRAIGNCEETVQLSMTPAGRLSVRSGAFKAFIDCVQGETPHPEPEGDSVSIDGAALLQAFKTLAPFIGDDAARPWANGVLLRGASAFATNNVTLVECWLGFTFPKEANVPRQAVREMLRINEAPVSAQMTNTSITFHYSEGRWVRTQLFSTEWPDLAKVLECKSSPVAMDNRLFIALEKIKTFTDKIGRVYIGNEQVATHPEENTEGAAYDVPGLRWEGIYQLDMLNRLQGVALSIDWSGFPGPCMFFGDRVRGAIIGMRL